MMKFTFPKKFRLLTFSYSPQLFQHSKQVRTESITILGKLNSLEYPRIGLIISKKNVKNACKRNAIKRLIRESFRLCQHKILVMDFVVIIKKEINSLDNHDILKELEKLWFFYYQSVQNF